MFSYLRPHRRTPSNPASPIPEVPHSWESPLQQPPEQSRHDGSTAQSQASYVLPTSFLPPITNPPLPNFEALDQQNHTGGINDAGSRTQWSAASPSTDSQEIGELALSPQPRFYQKRPESAGNAGPSQHNAWNFKPHTGAPAEQYTRERTGNSLSPYSSGEEPRIGTFFGGKAIEDAQQSLTGRRPAGARMPTPPPQPVPKQVSSFEPAQHRTSKTRLNLLNPMSLLARRRTSQAIPQVQPIQTGKNGLASKPADAFVDPRIRGTRIHDFSAPRQPIRNLSANDVHGLGDGETGKHYLRSPSGQYGDQDGDDTGRWHGNHTPVFTEDFDEEQYPAAGPHVRKTSDLSHLTAPKPAFARESRRSKSDDIKIDGLGHNNHAVDMIPPPNSSPPAPPVPPKADGYTTSIQTTPQKLSVRKTTDSIPAISNSPMRPRNVSEVSAKDLQNHGLPKHMESTSSRFSFDMIGAAKQAKIEKVLEDRHRQKELERQSASPVQDEVEEEVDDYDYDNMDDDDGLEEEIPLVGADDDDDMYESSLHEGEEIPTVSIVDGVDLGEESIHKDDEPTQAMAGFSFKPIETSLATSPETAYSPAINTPRDVHGDVIGFAVTKESPNLYGGPFTKQASDGLVGEKVVTNHPVDAFNGQGLRLSGSPPESTNTEIRGQTDNLQEAKHRYQARNQVVEDDDLYFDDGMIDQINDSPNETGAEFDESVFDNDDTDQYGRPIRPLSSLPTLYSPPYIKTDFTVDGTLNSNRTSQEMGLVPAQSATSPKSVGFQSYKPGAQEEEVTPSMSLQYQPSTSLTHDTLSAYQSALAAAAHKAAESGRFRRDSAQMSGIDEEEENTEHRRSEDTADSAHTGFNYHANYDDDGIDDFDYDDALEDDDIVAEANASALAMDGDGFYGQEFGFYSAPAASEALYVNGGYFGPRGGDNLNRSKLARQGVREPNLTPITERSEYSNRNSFMSQSLSGMSGGGMGHQGSHNITSPGLAQLAGMMGDYDDENMSFGALLRMRRGAWGGSQVSLPSSNGNGSPMSATGGEEMSPVHSAQSVQVQNSLWPPREALPQQKRTSTGFSTGLLSDKESLPGSPSGHSATPMSHSSRPEHAHPLPMSATRESPGMSFFSLIPAYGSPKGVPTSPISAQAPAQTVVPSSAVLPNTTPLPTASLLTSLASRGNPTSPTSNTSPRSSHSMSPSDKYFSSATFGRPNSSYRNHRHSTSLDSISYMKEEDPVEGERWVLERRRTADSGEVEILGREVVSGGRI